MEIESAARILLSPALLQLYQIRENITLEEARLRLMMVRSAQHPACIVAGWPGLSHPASHPSGPLLAGSVASAGSSDTRGHELAAAAIGRRRRDFRQCHRRSVEQFPKGLARPPGHLPSRNGLGRCTERLRVRISLLPPSPAPPLRRDWKTAAAAGRGGFQDAAYRRGASTPDTGTR
jgi:hypothetical protein